MFVKQVYQNRLSLGLFLCRPVLLINLCEDNLILEIHFCTTLVLNNTVSKQYQLNACK